MSLNHAVREQSVLAAHVIDLDVIDACAEAIEQNARVLVMPWYPHVHNLVGKRDLANIAAGMPLLRQLDREGRLLWYDLSTSPVRYGPAPTVEATYFSAEAALNLLAAAGVLRVRSLGVDGGSEYSGAFKDLRDVTLLANGQSSFDLQFEGFARTILKTGLDFAPLDRPAPVLIYSMYRPNEVLPLRVLEHSIRRRASLSVRVVPLSEHDTVSDLGRALVLPPRALVRGDVRGLWPESLEDRELLVSSSRWSDHSGGVALVGAALGHAIPVIASAIRQSAPLAELGLEVVPTEWNPPAAISGESLRVLHFSADGTEPWLSRRHPLGHLWIGDLLAGILDGSIATSLVADEVRRGHVRPSLLYQIEHGIYEPSLLGRRARELDLDFQSRRAEWSGGPALPTVIAAIRRELSRRLSEVLRAGRALYHMGAPGRVLMRPPSS
jgi:hypothetical protein